MRYSTFIMHTCLPILPAVLCVLSGGAHTAFGQTAAATITVNANQPTASISQNLVGVFFEDISFGADGGLYGEMAQNRSFEYSSADRSGWNSLTDWTLVQRGGGSAAIATETTSPLNANNPTYLKLTITTPGTGVGVSNDGYFGMNVEQGKVYDFSVWARRTASLAEPLTVQLESTSGTVYAGAQISPLTTGWARYTASLTANTTDRNARLVVLTKGSGTVYMDMISLFPRDTFLGHPNGLRKDLAQYLVDMKAKFIRFPGGCVVHGYTLATAYHWKNSVGPVEERKEQPNFWGYHMTYGMGYYEIFQLCEDLGAKPLPILSAGVSCQFNQPSGYQVATLLSPGNPNYGTDWDLNKWTQDALDLIEWANGPSTSVWGAKRAAAGHIAPFNLEYIGIGNEEWGTDFKNNFTHIYNAIRAAYPNIKVIGTMGAGADDGDGLMNFNAALGVDMVDEHYYVGPDWLLTNNHRYDSYSRTGPKTFIGEYACQGNALQNAICEASYLTGLERNADQVVFASYAPLYCNAGNQNWSPNLIWFDDYRSYGSPNYYAQKLFANNLGDRNVANTCVYTSVSTAISGKIGVGTWSTQAKFRNVSVKAGANTLFTDNFANANNWTVGGGTWAVSSNTYVQSSSATPAYSTAYNVTGQTTYTYELDAMKTGGAEGFLIMLGYADANNYFWCNLGGWGNSKHAVEKCASGGKSIVGSSVGGSISSNVWHHIKVAITGRRIQCYLDNSSTPTLDVTDGDGINVSSSTDNETGDVILKLVNPVGYACDAQVNVNGTGYIAPTAQLQRLTGSPTATNSLGAPTNVAPTTSTVNVGTSFTYSMPAWSLNILRLKTIDALGDLGLRGEYYDNADLTGLKFVREDPTIDFNWGTGTPHASISPGTYSARWTGRIIPAYSETYTFYTTSSDGVRLWVNGQKIIDNWTVHTQTVNSATISLQAGVGYDIKLEYFENAGSSIIKLEWQSANQARQVVPQVRSYIPAPAVIGAISDLEGLPDASAIQFDKNVTLAPKSGASRVTSPFFFYVEDTNWSGAIRVEHGPMTSDTLAGGNLAHVEGILTTNPATGERFIMPGVNPTSSTGDAVKPLGMNGRAAQSDDIGVAKLVTIWGKVRHIATDKSYFTISDGYAKSGSESPTKVLVYGDSNINLMNEGDNVQVTGVLSREAGEADNVIICRAIKLPA